MPTIRIYKEHRLEEVMEIRRKVFTEELQIDEAIEIDEYDELDRDDVIHFAYWHDKDLIASARAIIKDPMTIVIGRVATLKEFRNKGYASKLISDIELYFHNIGFTRSEIHAQHQVVDFYLKLGYKKEGEPFLEADIEHQLMVKDI